MPRETEERAETSLRDFVAVVFRRKWIILGLLLASIGVVVLIDRLSPVEYEAYSQLLISRGQPESAYTSRVRVLSWEEDLNSELEMVKSAQILQMAQRVLDEQQARDSQGQPIKIRPQKVDSTTPGKSSIIYIRVKDPDPVCAKEIARAITQAYSAFRLNVRTVPEIDAFFRDQIESVRQQLEDWEQKRADFMNEESVAGLDGERASLINVKEQAERSLNDIRQDLAADQAKVELLQSMLDQAKSDPDFEIYPFTETNGEDNQILLQIRRELVSRRSQLYEALGQYQEAHPTVQRLRSQVAELQQLMLREVEGYLQQLRAAVDVQRAREESLLSTLAYCDGELSAFPSKEARLAAFDRVIDALRADHGALVDRQIQAKLERVGSPDWNVLVLQPASEPLPVKLNDAVRLAVIPAVGLVLALALAFLIDGMDHSIKDATEAERHLGVPVLGSIGRLR